MMNFVSAIASNGEYQTLAALYDKDNKLLIPLAATGTGAGVFTLRLYSTVTSTAYISGIGRFYTDAAGTLGEATSMTLTANALTTLYVRLSSGSAYVIVDNANAIPCFGSNTRGDWHSAFTEATNAPKINGMDISYLKYCTEIQINSNLNLSVIKGSVAGLTALTYLQLNGDSLTCSGSVEGLTALTYLVLISSQLTCSGSVAGLTSLKVLNLDGNQLTCSGSVAGLTALTYLNLNGNQLTCSGSVEGLTALTYLVLIGSQLTCSGSVAGLTSLTYLILSGNSLTCSGSVAGLTALTTLILVGNLLTCSGSVAGLTALTYLRLDGNSLTCSGSVAGLTALTYLNLNGNQLTCSGSVAGLTALTYLQLNGDSLTCSGSVAGLTALTYLILNGNLLTCSGSVAGLTALTYLDLTGDSLTCSGSVKELLKKLTNLYIKGRGLSIYYETPDYFPATIDRYYLASAAITAAMADQIFIDLAASSVMASGSNKLLAIPSPGGAVSDASLAARNLLQTTERGFTVQVHS